MKMLTKMQRMLSLSSIRVLAVLYNTETKLNLCVSEIRDKAEIPSGTVVGILMRFSKEGWTKDQWERDYSPRLGRPRLHRYWLTSHGKIIAEQVFEVLEKIVASVHV